MSSRKFLKLKWTPESIPTAWGLNTINFEMSGFEEEMAPIEEAEESQEVVCHVPESPTESGTSDGILSATNSSKLSYHERLSRTRKTMNDMESEASC